MLTVVEAGTGQGQGEGEGQAHGTGPAPSTAPPGWYPDPEALGRQRWWDGAQWTEHVHPPAGGAAPHPPAYDPAWVAQRAESDARQWAMLAHLSALIALFTGLNWLGPLIIYLVKKNDHPFVAEQAREALNFNISVFIYMVVTFALIFVLAIVVIGFFFIPVAIAIAIAWLVLVIIAGVRANAGEPYRYPLTIRMVG